MNVTYKRLLSWLVVVTMVLSMVPVVDLSNFAVTTKASENEATEQTETLTPEAEAALAKVTEIEALGEFTSTNDDKSYSEVCPVCGGTQTQTWTAIDSTFTSGSALATGHYYLSESISANAASTAYYMGIASASATKVCLNLNGKNMNITGGRAFLSNFNYGMLTVMDTVGTAEVTSNYSNASYGSVFHLNAGGGATKVNIYGGTFKNAGANGMVVQMGQNGGTFSMYGGKIDNSGMENKASRAVYIRGDATKANFNMFGGEIIGGISTSDGASVCVGDGTAAGEAIFNMYGGTVSGGETTRGGGNFNVNGGILNVFGGTISGGKSGDNGTVSGGNIMITASGTLNVTGGVIANGTATGTFGGNIAIRNDNVGHIDISGGKIYGGTAGNQIGHNISAYTSAADATLKISGTAEIAGDIYTNNKVAITLSGTPKILATGMKDEKGNAAEAKKGGLEVASTSNITIGELNNGARIEVTGTNGVTFATCDNAAVVAQYFDSTTLKTTVGADGTALKIVDKEAEDDDVFEPWDCVDNKDYCDACLAQLEEGESRESALVEWTALSGATERTTLSTGHYYLDEDNTTGFSVASGAKVCLNLNGKKVAVDGKVFSNTQGACTLNIMDTAGATVSGCLSDYTGEVFDLRNPNYVVNVYGGTFVKADGADLSSAIVYFHEGGTFNMHGGTIDGTGVTNTAGGPCVKMRGTSSELATFTMYGGEIKGGKSTADGGNIVVGGGSTGTAVFELCGGTVSGGYGKSGGNFLVNGGSLKVEEGIITNGKCIGNATVSGGNIMLTKGGTLNMTGGVISSGVTEEYNAPGGNISIRTDDVGHISITGGKIYGGTAANATGHNISAYSGTAGSTLTIGGTAEIAGDIYTGANVDITLSGTPKILISGLTDENNPMEAKKSGLEVTNSSNIDVDDLTEGADIQVTGETDVVFATSDKAAELKEYFSTTDTTQKVEAEEYQLKIYNVDVQVPVKGAFAPELCGGRAYCEHCGTIVEWQAIDSNFVGGTSVDHDTHWYLSEDITNASVNGNGYYISKPQKAASQLCIELNGKELTVTDGRVFMNNFYMGTLNVMDTKGGAVVTGNGTSGAVFYLNGSEGSSKVNVYGGTFKTTNGNSVVYIGGNGGTFNLHGGKLDATGATGSAFGMQGTTAQNAGATFNMYNGEIVGNGEIAGRVGTVLQANANGSYLGCATFNMISGTVSGGYVQVRSDNTANISGGTIEYLTVIDGAYEEGGNDVPAGKYEIKNDDGEVTGTFIVTYDGKTKVELSNSPKIARLDIGENVVVNIEALSGEAKVAISGELGAKLIETANAEALKNYITSYYDYYYVDIQDENAFVLRLCEAAVQTVGGMTYYPTVTEAVTKIGDGYLVAVANVINVTLTDGQEIYIDNRGNTVNVSGNGTLYAMDSANDAYSGYGTWKVDEGVTVIDDVINPVNGNRYIVIKNTDEDGNPTGTYDAHRIQMYLTGISLRPSAAGLYYKAAYKCDSKLAALVTEYGIALRVDCEGDKPELDQSNFKQVENDKYSILEGFKPDANHTVKSTSTLVYGIFKDVENRPNAQYGKTAIEATPYIKINGEYLLANIDDATANAEVYEDNNGRIYEDMSMYDVLEHMNEYWDEAKYGSVKDYYNIWKNWGLGLSAWEALLPNISGYVAPEAEA